MDFPHGKDVQHPRTIRSQTPVLSGDEGLYPLSYGCVWGDCIYLGGKSQEMQLEQILLGKL